MDKKIPIYFDTIILDSPLQDLQCKESSAFRVQVGVFTKYKNRNGSYITDEYAEFLIKSATRGNTPVVGFFDPEEKNWATHTGPKLANGYGYVEDFVGWVPMQDTDGVTRDYAVFSVVLFTDYYEEARKIKGQHQSMELNPKTIEGDWAEFDGEYYYVYTKGDMLGLCVIGSHEPCFSVSSFFSKDDDTYKSQYEKFSSFLSDLRAQVEETNRNKKGGELPMEFENQEKLTSEEKETIVTPEDQKPDEFQADTTKVETQTTEIASTDNSSVESITLDANNQEATDELESTPEVDKYELLQQQHTELHSEYEKLQSTYAEAMNRIAKLEEIESDLSTQLETLRTENTQLQAHLSSYQEQMAQVEYTRKNKLIDKYEKNISDAEQINEIKESINDFSYDELESKLAILFANQQLANMEQEEKIPLAEPPKSQFALLMEKYRITK